MQNKIISILLLSLIFISCHVPTYDEEEEIIPDVEIVLHGISGGNSSGVLEFELSFHIKNNTEKTFYSKLGDEFNSEIGQNFLYYVNGASIYLEILNENTNNWEEVIKEGDFNEEVGMTSIIPVKSYRIDIPIKGDNPITIPGLFRVRLEYFLTISPTSDTIPFMGYSDEFSY